MKKRNWIPWSDVRDKLFTKEEQKVLDRRAELKMLIRTLRELRSNFNLTQSALAIKSGVPRTTISKIESGYHNASIGKLMQLAEALNTRLEIRFVPKKV